MAAAVAVAGEAAAAEAAAAEAAGFYARLPVFDGFARVTEPGLYAPLPDGWVLGLTDVVGSTDALRAGRYKDVNMAGAAAIAAVGNALPGRELPFVFAGDGASFAVPGGDAPAAAAALAATAAWARDELGLELRAATVPVAAVRARGLDVRVARFRASPDVTQAMFAGGGLAWAEAELKRGGHAVPPAPPGARPDLSGLSCRWEAIPSGQGVTLSVIVGSAGAGEPGPRFAALVRRLLALVEGATVGGGRPVADARLRVRWPPTGLGLEARASRAPGRSLARRRLALLKETLISSLLFRLRVKAGGFDPAKYRREMVANADFRKYDDALRMTLDCTPALADHIEALLAAAAADGIARYGLHRQGAALVTCVVPSIHRRDHLHFIDGAAGGYAAAAAALKAAAGGAG